MSLWFSSGLGAQFYVFKEIKTPHRLPDSLLQRKKEELLLAMSFSHKAMTLGLLSFLGKPELVLVLYQQDILEECPVGTSQPLAP